MIQKRPYDGENVYDIACKHPRHWDNVNHFGPVVDIVPANSSYRVCLSSADHIVAHVDERCSADEYSSPKLGPEHQADVPYWCPRGHASDGAELSYEERLIGTCVIPMPRLDSLSDNVWQSYEHAEECDCLDHGSVTCIRRHVAEAREVLKSELGDDIFKVLGFNDMGETVSKKWTEEEEELFHNVVRTNPARLGKNFWVQLSEALPSRTKKDLASYYFNVFVLRRRMEQNRCFPLHIDSDDDGSQILEEDHGDDSMLESLTSQHDAATPHQEDQTEVRLDHIGNDVEAHKDAASESIRIRKPLDEAERSISNGYCNQNDSSVCSEIRKDKRQPIQEV